MFGRKPKFKADGFYDGHGYMAVDGGKIDVNVGGRIVRFNSIEEMIARLDRANVPSAVDVVPPISVAVPPQAPRRYRPRPRRSS